MKTAERAEARRLRAEGRSIKEIARVVGVSQSSVSRWARDVALSEEQLATLRARNPALEGRRAATTARIATWRARRTAYQLAGRTAAHRRDPWHIAGCMLYWAEGSRSRNSVQFTNSDPEMVVFFVRFLRRTFLLPDDAFRVYCNLFADHAREQSRIERFWLSELELPPSCLRKTTVNAYSKHSKRIRLNRLPYGTCRICVHSSRVVQSIYGAIQEYGGFDRSEWLD
jgi:hypothetical protein